MFMYVPTLCVRAANALARLRVCMVVWAYAERISKISRELARLFYTNEPRHEISDNVVCAASKASDQPAPTHSLSRAFASRLNILWLLSYWLNTIWNFLSLKWGCTGSSVSTLVKMPHCWKSHVTAQIWASAWDFQQFDILTSVDSDEPLQPPFKLRNSKWCSLSSLTIIEYSSD